MLFSTIALPRVLAASDTWYVGQGAEQNMYVKYTVQEYNTNQDRPFEITIYFQNHTSDGIWIAPTYIVDQSKVFNATLKLGENLSVIRTANDTIPREMEPYLGAYARTLQWLSAFSPQSQPQSLSLSTRTWGRIDCVGCGTLDPGGSVKATVQAGTFNTTILVNHRGQHDNTLWVKEDLPYPVKALVYADVTQGQPPIQFAFELIDIGTGKPKVPLSVSMVPQPPLTLSTVSGNYRVSLEWSPLEIQPSTPTTFTIHFKDNEGKPLSKVNYDFLLQSPDCTILQDRSKTSDIQGLTSLTVQATHSIWHKIVITINSINGQPTTNSESATFGIVNLQWIYGSRSQYPEACPMPTVLAVTGMRPVDVSIIPIWSDGGNVQFNITFYQKNSNTLQGVCYDAIITSVDSNKTIDRASDHGVYTPPAGLGGICGAESILEPPEHPINLENGNYTLKIITYWSPNPPLKDESVVMPIQVTPEFPTEIVLTCLAAIGVISILARMKTLRC